MPGTGTQLEAYVKELLGSIANQYSFSAGNMWLSVNHPKFPQINQGWKIHISARPANFTETLKIVVPILAKSSQSFKIAATEQVLQDLNSGNTSAASVGKAITVYPHQELFRDIISELDTALTGFSGPRIVSDYRITSDSVVYYRYGPFIANFRGLENGSFEPYLNSPDGQLVSGTASLSAFVAEWMNPPPDIIVEEQLDETRLFAGKYKIYSGITRSAKGSVYRAVDTERGQAVIIKQARAYIGENSAGEDSRTTLQHEYKVIKYLEDIPGTPQNIQYFSSSEADYIVIDDEGSLDLRKDVVENGVYTWSPTSQRSLANIVRRVATTIRAIHDRGVVVRDIAPKNIVLSDNGNLTIIDYEISSINGVTRYGWTPGYSSSKQRIKKTGCPEDDLFSLGMLLFYLATGMDPVAINSNDKENVTQTLQILEDCIGKNTPASFVFRGLTSEFNQSRNLMFNSIVQSKPINARQLLAIG